MDGFRTLGRLGVFVFTVMFAASARGGIFADAVVSYTPGSVSLPYFTSSAALGKPFDDVNAGQPFGYAALTPFNAAWQDTHLVGIGPGGSLTLHLGQTAAKIGVHAGVGLIDLAYPNGQNSNPASPYTNPREAQISVSHDGATYVSLGLIHFDIPTNYYATGVTAPGDQTTPGTGEADFAKPFTGTLASFNGKNWTATLATLDGSGGGKWLDVSGVLPAGANFVRFQVSSGQEMFLDAVATVAVTPEPGAMIVALLGTLALWRRRH